jgi:L-lactate dehydrogenase complex protein LldE
MNVQLFIPCFVDQLYPEVGMNTVKLLEKAGCQVRYNPQQTCCGQPAYNAGFMKEAKAVSEKFVGDFSGSEYIVAPSGSCIGYVRSCFDEIFENSAIQQDAKRVSNNSFELTEFLVNILKVENFGATLNAKATYHDACGSLRECGIKKTPRTLLSHVKGLELVEMKECETCCGFGGTFAIKYEPISIGMAMTKVKSAMEVGAEYIISTDISCLMHIDGYIKHEKLDIKTAHIAEVLVQGWQ